MKKDYVMGNSAIALGALSAGVKVVMVSYPCSSSFFATKFLPLADFPAKTIMLITPLQNQ